MLPTVTQLLEPLADVDDRGVRVDDGSDVSWRKHIAAGAQLAALLYDRLDPGKPPHVGVLLGNTPLFSALLVAAGMGGAVPVGLNPTRRGAALARDIAHADCQLVLTDSDPESYGADFAPAGVDVLDVRSPSWAEELAGFRDAPVRFRASAFDDLFMLIFTSGTSGDPKAVRCTHEKVAGPGCDAGGAFRIGAIGHLLPVDAAVPLQCGDGGLGARGRGGSVNCVAAQILRIAVHSRCPSVRSHLCQLRRQADVLHPGYTAPRRRCRQSTSDHVRQRGGTSGPESRH